jgi:predicted metal-dependent peptidase
MPATKRITTTKRITAEDVEKKKVVVKKMSESDEARVMDDLCRSRCQITIYYPFFGVLTLALEPTIDYTIDTAATDGKKFMFNPYFIDALSEPERNWIVIHEVMHPALKHLWRRNNRQHEKWNYACDYAIHSIIMQMINDSTMSNSRKVDILTMPKNCLYDSKYDNMSAEQIYDALPEDYSESAKFGNGKGNGNSKGQGQGNNQSGGNGQSPLDDHSKWDGDEVQKNKEEQARNWDGKLVSAAIAAASKMQGQLPAFLQRLVNGITKPQKNWRQLLAEFVEHEVCDYSWNNPDTRFDPDDWDQILMPSLSEEKDVVKNIIFWIDTSGSVSDKELAVAYSELIGACEQVNLKGLVGFFDASVIKPKEFESPEDILKIKAAGGGGTDITPAFEYMVNEMDRQEINGCVVISDLYLDFPDESVLDGIPVLWLSTTNKKAPYGINASLEV